MQTTPMWKTPVSIVLINALIVVLLASCASYHYEVVRPLDNLQSTLERGDTVRIVTTDGRDLEFPITFITSEAIEGEEQQVYSSDIATLAKRQPTPIRSCCGRNWASAPGCGRVCWVSRPLGRDHGNDPVMDPVGWDLLLDMARTLWNRRTMNANYARTP